MEPLLSPPNRGSPGRNTCLIIPKHTHFWPPSLLHCVEKRRKPRRTRETAFSGAERVSRARARAEERLENCQRKRGEPRFKKNPIYRRVRGAEKRSHQPKSAEPLKKPHTDGCGCGKPISRAVPPRCSSKLPMLDPRSSSSRDIRLPGDRRRAPMGGWLNKRTDRGF